MIIKTTPSVCQPLIIYTHGTTMESPNNLATWAGQALLFPLHGKKNKPHRGGPDQDNPSLPRTGWEEGQGGEGGAVPFGSHKATHPVCLEPMVGPLPQD